MKQEKSEYYKWVEETAYVPLRIPNYVTELESEILDMPLRQKMFEDAAVLLSKEITRLEKEKRLLFRALSAMSCMTENNPAGMEMALDVYNTFKKEYEK